MANPKYADLPGIAFDEPDVYETSDLPESEQNADTYNNALEQQPGSDSIQGINISAGDAIKFFAGKKLDASKVDFSERIKAESAYIGYGWELASDPSSETLLQKFQRLQCEAYELSSELSKLQSQKKSPDPSISLPSSREVDKLLENLNNLKLDEAFGQEANRLKEATVEQFLAQVETLKNIKAIEKDGNLADVTYQFNVLPGQLALNQNSALTELEKRIHRLEALVGEPKEDLARLAGENFKVNLMDTAQHLSKTASLLDPAQLDHIEGRLACVLQTLEKINDAKKEKNSNGNTADGEVSAKPDDADVLALYETVRKNEKLFLMLPKVVERLKALESLHENARDFLKTMTYIENSQNEMVLNLENNKLLLTDTQKSFTEYLKDTHNIVQSLENRIRAIGKK